IEACGLARRAEIRVGDWTQGLETTFDLIVSNPPYIPTADLAWLPRGVRDFDPWLALDGGGDGLVGVWGVLPGARALVAPRGSLIAEFGAGQATDVIAIARRCGFADAMTCKDLAGRDRVVAARV